MFGAFEYVVELFIHRHFEKLIFELLFSLRLLFCFCPFSSHQEQLARSQNATLSNANSRRLINLESWLDCLSMEAKNEAQRRGEGGAVCKLLS